MCINALGRRNLGGIWIIQKCFLILAEFSSANIYLNRVISAIRKKKQSSQLRGPEDLGEQSIWDAQHFLCSFLLCINQGSNCICWSISPPVICNYNSLANNWLAVGIWHSSDHWDKTNFLKAVRKREPLCPWDIIASVMSGAATLLMTEVEMCLPTKKIQWSPNPQYLRIRPYLETGHCRCN